MNDNKEEQELLRENFWKQKEIITKKNRKLRSQIEVGISMYTAGKENHTYRFSEGTDIELTFVNPKTCTYWTIKSLSQTIYIEGAPMSKQYWQEDTTGIHIEGINKFQVYLIESAIKMTIIVYQQE